VKTWLELTN